MTKAILSDRIYMTMPPNVEEIKEKLTYKIDLPRIGKAPINPVETIRNYKLISPTIISIPVGRLDLIPENYEVVDKRVKVPVEFPDAQIDLFPEQSAIVDQVKDSCMINAPPGWGKSISGLYVAKNLGQKTLVVTHTVDLRNQWVSSVQKLFGITPGVIGSGKVELEPCIVVGNVQTITKIVPELSKTFGTLILDECLDYSVRVNTLEYGHITIGALVNGKKPASVLSLNENTKQLEYKKVLTYYKTPEKNCLKISHNGGGNIKCTPNHNVYTYADGEIFKIKAEYLEVGDYLLESTTGYGNNQGYSVRQITNITESTLTGGFKYNIEVEDNHNYFANNILVSNCHHVSAPTFSNIVDKLYCRYKVGLSATLKRKDKRHVIFGDYFGSTVYKAEKNNTIDPEVRIINPGITLDPGKAWAQKLNSLLYDLDYQQFIAEIAKIKIKEGYKVLITSSRTEFLENTAKMIGTSAIHITGSTGNRKDVLERLYSGDLSCICGSRQIFSEGISEDILSCLILAEPVANEVLLEQLCGRVMRKYPGKNTPLIIDINFSGHTERRQNNLRLAFYLEKGWKIL